MKKIVLIFFFIFALNGCNSSSLNIVFEDSQKILPKSDFDIISGITTVHYKFYVLISNDYSLDQDFTQEANNYVDKNVIKNENNIIYFISLENRMISIQATNTVAQIISQEQKGNRKI